MIRVTWLDNEQTIGKDYADILRQLCALPTNPDTPQAMLDALIDRTAATYRVRGGYSTDPADVFARLAEAGVVLLDSGDADGKGMLTP